MDEETQASEIPTVGERLRAAREEKGFSLDDIASETRIPLRHLESLEAADWERLPAPTYTIGFARNYANAVGLDRSEIGDQLRQEMGGRRPDSSAVEHFEPADPARAMPKWLVLSAAAAIVLAIIVFAVLRSRSLSEEPTSPPVAEQAVQPVPQSVQQQPQPAQAQGPVVLSATAPAWVRVTDQGKTLFEGMLQPGKDYQVPQTASAPMLRVGAPEALQIKVGQSVAPPVGPAGQVTSNVSLLPSDLMRGPSTSTSPPQPGAAPATQNSLAQ
jgi:cytoskeletal protein RodZ